MCNPAFIAVGISVAATAAGTAVQAVASHNAGISAQRSADYNSRILEYQARDALDRGAARVSAHRHRVAALLGMQRARMAAAGIDVTEGNAVDIQVQTTAFGELDAAAIYVDAEREALALRHGARLTIFEGDAAKRAGDFNAAGIAIAGAGRIAGSVSAAQAGGLGTSVSRPGPYAAGYVFPDDP